MSLSEFTASNLNTSCLRGQQIKSLIQRDTLRTSACSQITPQINLLAPVVHFTVRRNGSGSSDRQKKEKAALEPQRGRDHGPLRWNSPATTLLLPLKTWLHSYLDLHGERFAASVPLNRENVGEDYDDAILGLRETVQGHVVDSRLGDKGFFS